MSVHVITASAGSGKTYRLTEVLSERLSQTTDDGQPVLRASEVIATTFTVRAAAPTLSRRRRSAFSTTGTSPPPRRSAPHSSAPSTRCPVASSLNTPSTRGSHQSCVFSTNSEQAIVFTTAVDAVVAEAEATHRDLLVRTGHNGSPGDSN